jgi:transposase
VGRPIDVGSCRLFLTLYYQFSRGGSFALFFCWSFCHKPTVARDWREERIEELEKQLAERDCCIETLHNENELLRTRVRELDALVGKLREKASRNSRNSSKPPSSDGPAKPVRRKQKRSGRKRGGQVGHEKHERELVPVEQVDSLTVVKPTHCADCSTPLLHFGREPERHQHYELPEVKPLVHEVQVHSGWCEECQTWTRGELPADVPRRAFGPSVDAVVGVLMGVYRLSKRSVAAILGELFHLKMSVGAVVDCQRAVSDALEQPVAEARAEVSQQPVKNADETSWRQGNQRAWLWAVVTATVTVFLIQGDRSADAARALLGGVFGILGTDRYVGYSWWPILMRQVCWAHLIRDFTAISERDGDSERIGKALLAEAERMFGWWNRVREGTLRRDTFQVYMRPLRHRVQKLLEQGTQLTGSKTAGTCKKILEVFPALWTFVRVEGVEPTNNTAERTVRHGVIYRKITYGTQSEWGSRFVERILTVHATCKQQGRSALQFIRRACESALTRSPPPSLIPAAVDERHDSTERPAARAA